MKKLLIIGSYLNYGSPGIICEQIGLASAARGWECYMVHGFKYRNPSKLKTFCVVSKFQELVHKAVSFLLDAHGLASGKETKRLVKLIKRIEPDVINLHNLHGYYLNYEVLFKFLRSVDIPIVWTLHDFWPVTGHCVHFDYEGCDKWKTGCAHCPQLDSYPRSLFLDRSERNYKLKKSLFTSPQRMTIIPVSHWVASLVKESFLGKYPIHAIYNGVDMNVFKHVDSDCRQRLGLEGKFVLLGVSSPWYKMKGFDDYMELGKRISDDCRIVMVGVNRKQTALLPPNMIGLERTDSMEELVKYYSMADVVLNLSYQETLGMTTVEGLACGTPEIVYNRTASPELLTPETGRIVEAGNIEQLVAAVVELKAFGKERFEKACRKRAVDCFNGKDRYNEYVDLFESLTRKV